MTETRTAAAGFLDRTLRNLRTAWRDISETARGAIGGTAAVAPALPSSDLDKVRARMRECLEGKGGEVSTRARAAELEIGRAHV